MTKENKESYTATDIETMHHENEALKTKLTNKNNDYIFSLEKKLEELSIPEHERIVALNEMLHELMDLQAESITARRHYGTVGERAEIIAEQKVNLHKEEETSPKWLVYLDGALLLGGLFAAINGIGMLTTEEAGRHFGIFHLITNFIFGGFAMMVLTKYAPKPGKKGGMFQYILATIGVMMAWFIVGGFLLYLIPPEYNPALPPLVMIAIGIGAIALKIYLKNTLDIKGTLF